MDIYNDVSRKNMVSVTENWIASLEATVQGILYVTYTGGWDLKNGGRACKSDEYQSCVKLVRISHALLNYSPCGKPD